MSDAQAPRGSKLSFNATWSMAVGGMVGGGIFSVLGVVVAEAAEWAWLSFVAAGLIAFVSAHSYSGLSVKYGEGGGAFTFLREINHAGFAGSLSWVLIIGYILTISVYAFTFGQYVAHVVNLGAWLPRVLSTAIILALAGVNLLGTGNSSKVEIVTVWGKLAVLLGLALWGVAEWSPAQLTAGVDPKPWTAALLSAATIFMAYEGFQLLSYDYEDLRNPDKTLPRATLSAVVAVIVIYVLVTLGATMLVGADVIVAQKEVALAIAGRQAAGTAGLVVVTIAAAFSTGSAINATLFSTARLMEDVAQKKDLPDLFARENKRHIPSFAIYLIAGTAVVLSIAGSLEVLVDTASLVFLVTFGIVNFLGFRQNLPYRYVCLAGAVVCAAAAGYAGYTQFVEAPWVMAGLLAVVGLIFAGRPWLLRRL